jgi:hypothetical protein
MKIKNRNSGPPPGSTNLLPRHKTYLSMIFMMLLLVPELASGQGYIEGMNINCERSPVAIKDVDPDESFTLNTWRFNMGFPVFLTKDKSEYLIIGAGFEVLNFSGTHSAFTIKNVYGIQPTIGLTQKVNSRLTLRYLFLPALNSDFDDVSFTDIKLGGIVQAAYSKRPGLTWRTTLGFRDQWFGPQIIALVGLDWKVNEKWRIFGDAPRDLTIVYRLNQKNYAGFTLEAVNTSYKLKNRQYQSHNTAQPGLFFERYLTPSLALRATVSYSFIRHEDINHQQDKTDLQVDFVPIGYEPDPLNPEFSKGANFKLALSYRVFR